MTCETRLNIIGEAIEEASRTRPQGEAAAPVKESLTTEPAPAEVEKEVAELVTDWKWIHNVRLLEIAEGALRRYITRLVSQAEQRARQAGREEAIRECAEAMCPNSPCKKAILSKLTPPTEGGRDV